LIEGSVTSGIDAIFLAINDEDLEASQLNSKIRELFIQYETHSFLFSGSKKTKKEIQGYINSLFDRSVSFQTPERVGYAAYLEKAGGEISGNLDGNKIKELAEKYGFDLPEDIDSVSGDLLNIKNKRNQLAHGEITFSVAGREKSIEELIALKNKITDYFRLLLRSVERYIQEKKYKNN
jgi:hypothetical protein